MQKSLPLSSALMMRITVQYERDGTMPPLEILELICKFTQKTADFLLFGVASENRHPRA
ncbi:MAG TPA: hypothetical protein VGO34_06990 [Alphaproteobacteria bacterium]|jgi:hypothetical protein